MSQQELRNIPSVDSLLDSLTRPEVLPRDVAKQVIQAHLEGLRDAIRDGRDCPPRAAIEETLERRLRDLSSSRVRPVVNATGVVLHTNLGRAPYAPSVRRRLDAVTGGYCNLEIDLSEGERGGRGAYGEALLETVTGADAAAAVNNCSAALMLALKTLADDRDVLISRGELVQIGGGFRIPEIMETSGASLREVGTTNRTSADDYREALDPSVAMILKVHRSNFEVQGFTDAARVGELAELSHDHGVPLVVDLGSGAVWNTEDAGLPHEPRPREALEDGADVVTFSGDKLMGGPQAGLLVGDEELIGRIKQHPLFRTVRCDKVTLTALEATLEAYFDDAGRTLPARSLLSRSPDELRTRAERLAGALEEYPVRAATMTDRVGGGSLPLAELAGYGVMLDVDRPAVLLEDLRTSDPPVVAPLKHDAVELHLRTVLEDQDEFLENRIRELLTRSHGS